MEIHNNLIMGVVCGRFSKVSSSVSSFYHLFSCVMVDVIFNCLLRFQRQWRSDINNEKIFCYYLEMIIFHTKTTNVICDFVSHR